jgi:hypothetical protein
MTFLETRQRIAELMGLNSADTTADPNATVEEKLKAWVNARYKAIAGSRSWNWLIGDTIIQTVSDITTGTVSVTNANTAITFSSGPAASVAGYFIQFEGSTDWYEISTHTAAATAAVLTVPFLGTTDGTATYILRKVYYALPSNTGKILDVRQSRVWNTKLRYIPARLLDQYFAYRNSTATRPLFYSINGLDSSRNYRMELFPIPDTAMNLNVRTYKVVTALSADDDVPLIPEAFHDILVWDVLATYGYMFLDDTRVSAAKALSNELYRDMKANDVAAENIPVRLPYDVDLSNNETSQLGFYNLPIQ